MDILNNKDCTICYSILVTEECNLNCSYCHFYANKRDEKTTCINEELLSTYIDLINYANKIKNQNIQIRFSGGEPLLLGEKLFYLADEIYYRTGIHPYVLTNGILLDEKMVANAKHSSISAFVISLENPFKLEAKSPFLSDNLIKIKQLSSIELPIIPGVVVVENKYFERLYDLCSFFYQQIGQIPTISEKAFSLFEKPSSQQLLELGKNIYKIILDYYIKTPVRLFPYITPELCSSFENQFVIDLPCFDKFGMKDKKQAENFRFISSRIMLEYQNCSCNKKCELSEACQHIKWFWRNKMESYCQFKKIIYKSYFNAFLELSD